MKIAFISDIHGNATALEAVLKDLEKKGVDQIAVLGDICFRGPEPKRALDMIRSFDAAVIKGNADEWVVRGIDEGEVPNEALDIMRKEREWTCSHLSEEDIAYLRNLPTELAIDLEEKHTIHAFHANPNNLFDVVLPNESNEGLSDKLMKRKDADIFLYGHIHVPYVRFVDGKCVANLGSVGLPFDGLDHACYLTVEGDGSQYHVAIHRVRYDIEQAIRKLKAAAYPNEAFLERVWRSGKV